jgi:hypothetical protein
VRLSADWALGQRREGRRCVLQIGHCDKKRREEDDSDLKIPSWEEAKSARDLPWLWQEEDGG